MQLDDLQDDQLAQVLQHLVSAFEDPDADPAITDDEIAARDAADRAILDQAAEDLDVTVSATPRSVRAVVEALADVVPETVPVIEAAADRARRTTTLPISDFAADILVVAAAVAVLKPSLHVKRANGELEVDIKAGGGKGIVTALTVILEHLRNGA